MSAEDVRRSFRRLLACMLLLHALEQVNRAVVVFSFHGDDHLSGDLTRIELSLVVGRGAVILAGARMVFALRPAAGCAEIPAASWFLAALLQFLCITSTVIYAAFIMFMYPVIDDTSKELSMAVGLFGLFVVGCTEYARLRLDMLRLLHKSLSLAERDRNRRAAAFPQMSFRAASDLPGSSPEATCNICLADFEDADVVSQLHCGHVYHTDCIRGWLATGPERSCPMKCPEKA